MAHEVKFLYRNKQKINTSNAELNPICHLLTLLGAHHILHFSRIRVNEELCKIHMECGTQSNSTLKKSVC